MTEQRIVCAALRHKNGLIICGVRHFDQFMQDNVLQLRDVYGRPEQGFVDNRYQFLTRKEAWVVAEAAGQIIRDHDKCPGTLYSEHLY